ncbi:hypothetical protein [Micromonospora inyonensis]|uniref:hypothetical protein n=1 Tax=Micromonospora inyonensis TaxID=47866 RepID=UPI00114C9FBF|nr:hypothetical protein [Micromonospora inyonensis]
MGADRAHRGCAAGWHVAYNLSSASAVASGTVAAVSTTIVMLWAVALLTPAYRATRRDAPSPLRGDR